MGILFDASIEAKRMYFISQLENAGITHHEGKSIHELDNRTLKRILAIHRIKQEK